MGKQDCPEEIHGWVDSQLSVARFYGGLTYNGHRYEIDERGVLVRSDVLAARRKADRKAQKAHADAERAKWINAQKDFLT